MDITWRVQRVTLLLRLANAPAGSWVHLALIAHHHLRTTWFTDAWHDMQTVLPAVRLVPTCVGSDPYLSSTGFWSDEGEWISLHAYKLPRKLSGHSFRPREPYANEYSQQVKRHIKWLSQKLRTLLVRRAWSETSEDVCTAASTSASPKLTFVALRLEAPGRPLHMVLDLLPQLVHRAALASFLCSDWFLGKHARNYFAKALLPALPRHQARLQETGLDREVVCLASCGG